ncbi:Intermembrane lipid transfer protein VPS13-like protein [Drosera capensis]
MDASLRGGGGGGLLVLHLLRRYLGEYVHGLSAEALRISVWKGDVILKDLKLKAEALNSLKLPVTVKAGFIGNITLKVPWKSLGKEPVIVLIDRVFILAYPVPDGRTLKEEDMERLFKAKLHEIEEAEAATLEAMSRSKLGNPPSGNSWLGSLVATVIGNLKITISNVHIRYEDPMSNPGRPFACGLTLAKLAAVTMDDQGNETFDTSGALDRLRKSLQLERLAVYHDSDRPPWKIQKRWEDLIPIEWVEIFEEGINEPGAEDKREPIWALDRTYLVSPINGTLKYHRLGSQERNDPDNPFEKAAVVLDDVSLTITEAQYYDWIKLFEVISRYRTHVEVSHLRPVVSISEAPHLWWRFAVQAALQQRKIYRFSWERIQYLCQLRRRYILLYVSSLQQSPLKDVQEMRLIERDLDSKVVLLWRGSAVDESSDAAELTERKFTKEEWKAINNLLSYQPDGDLTLQSGKDMPNAIQYLIEVSIRQAAAQIIDLSHTEIICGRFEQLNISTKFKHRSILCDVSLRFYGLSSPEGSLAQSVSNEQKQSALAASFVHSPLGENVDWRLSATMCPCHVTVLLESYERLREFLDRSNAVSPTIAMETASALQMKFEKVTRKAQEQFQVVLEEQSRFALHIDFDAPKVRVPIRKSSSSICDGHFLIDFGHFTLRTKDCNSDEKDQSLYSRFYISGRDISAIYSDCGCEGQKCSLSSFLVNGQSSALSVRGVDSFFPLVDKCGMAVVVDQIKVPHPSYPWMRISVQVPNLGIHVSPARYSRVVELLNILYSAMQSTGAPLDEDDQSKLTAWSSADMDIEARVLVWKGIGNSIATWHPCFLVLSGCYLYVLDSRMARSYRRCLSMGGKQVYEVPSTNVGGSLFSIVVCSRGMDLQKALEASSTLIIEFQNQDDKSTWIKGLKEATYQASAPLDIFGYSTPAVSEFSEARVSNLKAADLVINGTLMETKLFIYGKRGDDGREKNEETLLVEGFGAGGKVHLVLGDGNLAVNVKLHSLKIKDELQGHLAAEPQYLAYSVVKNEQFIASPTALEAHVKDVSSISMEEGDIFNDALPEFLPGPESIMHSENFCPLELDSSVASYADKDPGKGRLSSSEIFYETVGSDSSDFVSLNFVTKDLSSPDYDGIDTQMSVYMSKMEFFCNRPTLVALIGFGLDVSSANYAASAVSATMISDDILAPMKEKIADSGNAYVKGLLGFGKGRVVFKLSMIVDSVTVTLNKEDGSQLAIFVQESFILDLKVHPCSISIEGKLGNLRLQDVSLGNDHCWSWLCDIRNPGVESLIKFTFKSYSAEDDDYAGYDCSLCGRLSGVRIVFLYRFVREISAYFMELATPHTEEVIKLVDKVGDFEWFIQKYEIDGSSSIKLDLSLDTPIIIIPKSSTSKDYMQLDLGQLQVRNEFVWHGGPKNDPSAVHLDVLRAEILGINMAVGIDGCLGKPMIREGDGFVVSVRRSLRDVFRKVPTFSLEVQIDSLHGVMLDKEYDVILNCAYANMNEEPRLPPSFRAGKSGSADTMKLLVDKVNINSQNFLSRTVTIVAVEVNHALLELCTDVHEISALAHISLEGLWVSYRMTSLSEADLYVTVPKFCIMDARPDSKPEMRLMLGSSSDISRQGAGCSPLSFNSTSLKRTNSVASSGVDISTSTMLLLDYRWRATSQSSVVRTQLPRILVVPDFLLAVGEFFVPALGAITGRDEMMDPDNDPIRKNSSIALSVPVYKQQEEVVWLSPSQQLIADHPGVDDYTYDGCGKTILLKEENNPKESNSSGMQPIIVIGRGKRLRFVNVKIENGSLLRKYTYLSNDSSYSASPEDGVDIVFLQMLHSDEQVENQEFIRDSLGVANSSSKADPSKMQSFTFEAQVISPELTFYDGTKSSQLDSSQGEKLLRAKFDLSFMYASKEDDTWVRSLVKDLTIEAGSGLVILDPVDIAGGYTSLKDKTNMSLTSTDIHFHLSLSVISLLLNLQTQASAALQFGNANPVAPCTNYERVWVSPKEHGPRYNLTFWRPRPPSNYVILGDCVTSRPIPPSQAIMAVSNTYGRVRKPVSYRHIGLLSAILGVEGDEETRDTDAECSLWLPVAPTGYVTLGCVVNVGNHPPPTHVAYCIRADLVTSTMYSECIYSVTSTLSMTSGFSIWRLDNVLGSFIAHSYADCPPKNICYDLNHCLVWNTHLHRPSMKRSKATTSLYTDSKTQEASNQTLSSSGWDIIRSYSKANNCFISTPNFERIWWDKGGDLRHPISIWRPIPRPGYAVLGDCIAEGLEPPALGILFLTDNPEISAKPVQFTKVAQIIVKGVDEAFFWYPIAPPGYVSIGCIVTRADEPPILDVFCCPRMDLVNPANIVDAPISRSSSSRPSQSWSLWKVENQACTFLARSDMKRPSSRLAYTIGDFVKPKARENVTAELKLRCLSLTVVDSLCGIVTPLFDLTVTNIKLATHGRLEAINAVLVSSMAASTFNGQLGAWEPLVEPFDGIFK